MARRHADQLGSLGGALFNIAVGVNNRGQVVGESDLSGDTAHHAFLWENGVMTDLGTLPGIPNSLASSINNRGQAVGFSVNTTTGEGRGFVLTPVQGSERSTSSGQSRTNAKAPVVLPENVRKLLKRRMDARQHWPYPSS